MNDGPRLLVAVLIEVKPDGTPGFVFVLLDTADAISIVLALVVLTPVTEGTDAVEVVLVTIFGRLAFGSNGVVGSAPLTANTETVP
jgi:hypothetical protein